MYPNFPIAGFELYEYLNKRYKTNLKTKKINASGSSLLKINLDFSTSPKVLLVSEYDSFLSDSFTPPRAIGFPLSVSVVF
jgi:hypothetical protein